MSWIKRNLYFLVGGGVAVALLGLAGFYFYSKWSFNHETLDKLNAAYDEWEKITMLNPNPGNDKVDNIKLAKEQKVQVAALIQKVYQYFQPIPSIPTVQGTNQDFTDLFRSSLRRTVDQMQKDATTAGVTIPPRYKFTFEAQSSLFNFAQGTVEPLSSRLGDVKAICNVLFRARVNSLDNLRRERVGTDDQSGPQVDYLDSGEVSVTNDLAVLVPYEVTFHCFSGELAGVLAGFANTSNGFIVKSINVDSSGAASLVPGPGGAATPDTMAPAPAPNPYANPYVNPYANPYAAAQPAVAPAAAAPARGALPTVLDEKQLKVTLVVDVVKLLPKK